MNSKRTTKNSNKNNKKKTLARNYVGKRSKCFVQERLKSRCGKPHLEKKYGELPFEVKCMNYARKFPKKGKETFTVTSPIFRCKNRYSIKFECPKCEDKNGNPIVHSSFISADKLPNLT